MLAVKPFRTSVIVASLSLLVAAASAPAQGF
jgi:hypothetical protein